MTSNSKARMEPAKYYVIGLMSGTSLDGLDMAYCEFIHKQDQWHFKLKAAETKRYNTQWRKRLAEAHLLPGEALQLLDNEFGVFIGKACNDFIKKNRIKTIHFIASHGHTIFHQPKKRFTFQLGNGCAIHNTTTLPVVNDFRSLDVLKGGEGAPLVPIGDQILFSQFDVCLNIGGIANLSKMEKGKRIAFDICYANMGLNYLATKINKEFDRGGRETSKGNINNEVLNQLRKQYARLGSSKPSLGREGFEKHIQPIIDIEFVSVQDRLRTFTESISEEIAALIPDKSKGLKLLATGGGALNAFLVDTLEKKLAGKAAVVVPDTLTVNYKEAIVFALLGILRVRNEINVLKSVTGASSDSCAGVMIGFYKN